MPASFIPPLGPMMSRRIIRLGRAGGFQKDFNHLARLTTNCQPILQSEMVFSYSRLDDEFLIGRGRIGG